jgi:hypothetical protein
MNNKHETLATLRRDFISAAAVLGVIMLGATIYMVLR